jgi:tetratricopeptide (TPR) repeat protein
MNHLLIRLCLALCLLQPLAHSATAASADNTELQVFKAQTEAKIEAAKENQQKDLQLHQQLVSSQNERIEQINHQVDWLGHLITLGSLIITLLLVVIGYFAYGKAKSDAESIAKTVARDEANTTSKDEVKKWFDDNLATVHDEIHALKDTLKQTTKEVDAHAEQAHQKIDAANADLQAHASQIIASNPLSTDAKSALTATDKQALVEADTALQDKPESQYTFDDWNTRAHTAYAESNHTLAAEYWKKASRVTVATDEQVAEALHNQGVTLGQQNKYDEAIACYQQVVQRFGDSTRQALQGRVAVALNGLGFAQLLKAKLAWENLATRAGLLTKSLSLLEQATEKAQASHIKAVVLGNVSYALWLLGREAEVETPLREALTLGGEKTFNDEITDTKISPVPADSGFEQLVTRLWSEISRK